MAIDDRKLPDHERERLIRARYCPVGGRPPGPARPTGDHYDDVAFVVGLLDKERAWRVEDTNGYCDMVAEQVARAETAEAWVRELRQAIQADLDFYNWHLHTDAEDVVANIIGRRERVLEQLRVALAETTEEGSV